MQHRLAIAILTAFLTGAIDLHSQAPAPQERADGLELTIDAVHASFRSGTLTCRQLVATYLARIEAYDKSDLPSIRLRRQHACVAGSGSGWTPRSRHPGRSATALRPVLMKPGGHQRHADHIWFGGVQRVHPSADATVVTRLKKAGTVIIAKTTMGEYASGYFGSASGPIRNAYDPTRNASGSSGGTGSGIAANFALVGIAEDTGGSTRGPAAVNNLVGLRPTLPLVSRHGLFPARPSTDTLGPVARTVKDAALLFDAIVG